MRWLFFMNKKLKNKKIYKSKKKKRVGKYAVKLRLKNVNWDKVESIFSRDRKILLKDHKFGESLSNKEILTLLASGAVIALSFVIPVAPLALGPFILNGGEYSGWRFRESVKRLRKQKLVEIVHQDGEPVVKITEEGRMRALRYKLYEMEIKRPKRWDRKWRMVIFDIPEKYKRMREIFRQHLKLMEFYPLQKSVWVHPFPCFDEVEFLRQIYHVGVDVTYAVAERIEGVEDIKSKFDL